MMNRKRIILILVIAFIFVFIGIKWAQAEVLDMKAQSYILMDADSGSVLLSKNEHQPLPPASMTKLMTLFLALEDVRNGKAALQDKVTASDYAAGMGGSQIYLAPGEEMTLEELLIAIAVGSANDACVAVAEFLEGSEERFVERMNQKARSLGLQNTHFANTNGLPAPDHRISAYDMAAIAREAVNDAKVLEYSAIKEYDLRNGAFKLYNTNKLLWKYEGADGLKTGWTQEAQYCLVSTAKRDGLRLIAVVMGAPNANGHINESMKLYNSGFAEYSYVKFLDKNNAGGIVKVGKGLAENVEAVASENGGVIVLKGDEGKITYDQTLSPYIEAPVAAGQKLGEMVIYRDGEIQKNIDLVAARSVASGGWTRGILKIFAETWLFKG
ncbi:MAG: D-alanyl-D-alanine carboxypeptidase [Syntrophomonadaceae bacterium]|jgi:D-alanyl-D-alanine carboxypeptidase (penicillin-binding protein 5/6)|nr:D-alanyl-D-alanine carboxypeptidase [Syntrophomonadaceae bacterium]